MVRLSAGKVMVLGSDVNPAILRQGQPKLHLRPSPQHPGVLACDQTLKLPMHRRPSFLRREILLALGSPGEHEDPNPAHIG